MSKPLALTDVVLRDAHQSLFATRMRLEDMLPIAEELDKVGYWSLETWGGATFDCVYSILRRRSLGASTRVEKSDAKHANANATAWSKPYSVTVIMPMTWLKNSFERAHANGMDVFRIFDAMNDVRNFRKSSQSSGRCRRACSRYAFLYY